MNLLGSGGRASYADPSGGKFSPVMTQTTAGAIVGSSIALIIVVGLIIIFAKVETR